MKEPVDYVQAQLPLERVSESSGVTSSALRADENLAVLEGDYVRWSRFIHELSMQRRDLPIGDNQNRNLAQLGKIALFPAGQTKTKLRSLSREHLKIDNVHWH